MLNNDTSKKPDVNEKNWSKIKEISKFMAGLEDVHCDAIDSAYLMDESRFVHDDVKPCDLSTCAQLSNIINILTTHDKDTEINIVTLLNDFNHLLFQHSTEFEDIYNLIIQPSNNQICDLSKCLILTRNQRNRSLAQLTQTMSTNSNVSTRQIIQQQTIDRVHCYFFHTFDIGYRLTQNEKQNIINEESKSSFEYDIHSIDFDIKILKLHNLVQSKRDSYKNVIGLERLASIKKFSFQTEQKMDEYSYGFRYFYWDYYKNNLNTTDDAHRLASSHYDLQAAFANIGSTLCDWYISNRYSSFKEELLLNDICHITHHQMNQLLLKAQAHIVTDHVREMKCSRQKSAVCYDMKPNQSIGVNHLIAMMIYCNYDQLQFKFSETFRCTDNKIEEMKKKHTNYYFLGRLLRECVECFGMKMGPVDSITLYHGLSQYFMFSSMSAFIKGPFSSTMDYCVAQHFAQNRGMILDLNLNVFEWMYSMSEGNDAMETLTCFDCQWISDFPNEQEIFTIGGLNKLLFNTIIEAPIAKNYLNYIQAIKYLTYNCTNGEDWTSQKPASTKFDEQMVFRLLLNEIYRHFPNSKIGQKFESCPDYIKNIVHEHFINIKIIYFWNKKRWQNFTDRTRDVVTSRVHELIFKYDNDWIQLDLINTLFPNLEVIQYSGTSKDISFFQQDSVHNSIVACLQRNKNTRFRKIVVIISALYLQQLKHWADHHRPTFKKYSFDIVIDADEKMLQRITKINTDFVKNSETIKLIITKDAYRDAMHRNPKYANSKPERVSSYTWKVTDPILLKKSPEFNLFNLTWQLKICPNKTGDVLVLLRLVGIPPNIYSVQFLRQCRFVETGMCDDRCESITHEALSAKPWSLNTKDINSLQKYKQLTFKLDITLNAVFDTDGNEITNKYLQIVESKSELEQKAKDVHVRMNEEQKYKDHGKIHEVRKESIERISSENMMNAKQQKLKLWFENEVELPQYYHAFVNNGIDELSVVALIDKYTLKDIGIDIVEHQMKILNKAKHLKQLK